MLEKGNEHPRGSDRRIEVVWSSPVESVPGVGLPRVFGRAVALALGIFEGLLEAAQEDDQHRESHEEDEDQLEDDVESPRSTLRTCASPSEEPPGEHS
jgi:hypothetical protein